MFDKKWFKKHQRSLVWFANTWFGRRILKIHGNRSSVGKRKIKAILPNAIFWDNGNYHTAEFRTHDKFGKRLYYAFKPFWYLIHWWDMLIANNLAPNLNLGFDSLTVYPDADPESTSVDGYARRSAVDETWATIRGGAGTGAEDNVADTRMAQIEASTTTNQWGQIVRGIFLFDTSALSPDFVLTSATYSVEFTAITDQLAQSANVTSSSPASNTAVVSADYAVANFGSTKFASDKDITGLSTGSYTDFSLNGDGLSAITAGGITKFALRITGDIDNSEPTWASAQTARLSGYYADQTGTSSDPKLLISYTSSNENAFYFM